jgi:hypothetical protein
VLAGELARVRVAVARAKDDLAQGRMPDLADLQSLVAGVCAAVERGVQPAAAGDPAQAQALESLLAELNALEDEVRKFRDRMIRPESE